MKTLIIYYSFSGNNEVLAKELQNRLDCEIQKIVELKRRTSLTLLLDIIFKRKPRIQKSDTLLNQYDRIILIAPIWAGKIATPLKSFIELEKDNFKKYSFITICIGRLGQNKKITNELTQLVQKKPVTVSELMINKINYRVQKQDLQTFEKVIANFVHANT